jgi:hypothetical protein
LLVVWGIEKQHINSFGNINNMIIISVTLDKISTRVDKTIKIEFTTQELSAGDMTALFEHLHQYSYLALKDADIDKHDVSELNQMQTDPDAFVKGKTPGQRLRAVLYLYAKQLGKEKEFEQFYAQRMENLIELIKGKLED